MPTRRTTPLPLTLVTLAALALSPGCATVISMTSDGPVNDDLSKRSLGTYIDDEGIETKARVNIRAADPGLKDAHVRVTCFNGTVLLTGQVASEPLKATAESAIADLRHVKRVYNELAVAGETSTISRLNDKWLSGKVRTALTFDESESGRVKVVAENGTIYLMGLVTRDEGEAAAATARKVGGVQKIVKVFEYIN